MKTDHDNTLKGSEWEPFFKDADISPEDIPAFCKIFSDHKIRRHLLGRLTDGLLEKMGIRAVGDQLAILEQAAKVSAEISKETSSHSMVTRSEADSRTNSERSQTPSSLQVASESPGGTIRDEATIGPGGDSLEIGQGRGGPRDGRDDRDSSSERADSRRREQATTSFQGDTVVEGCTMNGQGAFLACKIAGGMTQHHHGNRTTDNRGLKRVKIKNTKGAVYANDGHVNNYKQKKRRRRR